MSRFGLKIVLAMLLLAVIPAVSSILLVGQVIEVTNSVAEGQGQRLARPLRRAAGAYREVFALRKEVFKLQATQVVADHELLRGVAELAHDRGVKQRIAARIRALMAGLSGLGEVQLVGADETPLLEIRSEHRFPRQSYRHLELRRSVGPGPWRLEMTFYTPLAAFADFRALGQAARLSADMAKLRIDLDRFLRVVFVIMFGAVVVVAMGVGLFIARRTTRRLSVLLRATREVAGGDLDVKVELGVQDELQELADSFNEMVGELKSSRETIAYLEKIGAWQQIARRLAHEIKNPLTPIQLAMQQLHRKYEGDDPRFKKMLDDAHDIISEEVDGLRRLVTAFSAFAKLPTVQPEPVELDGLVDDFLKSHVELLARSELRWQPLGISERVLADRMLIKHVLVNLVENAIHAAEGLQRVHPVAIGISATIERLTVRIEVQDDGPGMAPETLERAFDPYYTTKEHGTGLGLAIVKKIMLEHRGSVVLTSAPGKGTCVTLRLPRAQAGALGPADTRRDAAFVSD